MSKVWFMEMTGFKVCLQWVWVHLEATWRLVSGPGGQVIVTNYLHNLHLHPLGQSGQWPPNPAFLKAVNTPSCVSLSFAHLPTLSLVTILSNHQVENICILPTAIRLYFSI